MRTRTGVRERSSHGLRGNTLISKRQPRAPSARSSRGMGSPVSSPSSARLQRSRRPKTTERSAGRTLVHGHDRGFNEAVVRRRRRGPAGGHRRGAGDHASTKPSSEDDGESFSCPRTSSRTDRFNEAVVRRRRRGAVRGAHQRAGLAASTKPSSEDDGEFLSAKRAYARRTASTKPSSEDDGERRVDVGLGHAVEQLQRSRRPKTTESARPHVALGLRHAASTKPSSEDDGELLRAEVLSVVLQLLQRSRRPKTTERSGSMMFFDGIAGLQRSRRPKTTESPVLYGATNRGDAASTVPVQGVD